MEFVFNNSRFKFVRYYIDFTKELEKIVESTDLEGKIGTEKDELFLSFKKVKSKILVNFTKKANEEGKQSITGKFEIDIKPIVFQDVNKKCLFKIYNYSDLKNMEDIFKLINKDYDFYLPNNKMITFEELKKGDNKLIIFKEKIDQYNDIFKPLCKILTTDGKCLDINTNNLLPEKSTSLSINYNENFKLIIDSRISLINKIKEFGKNPDKYILKIYGSDGIGKSVTFLYFMSLETEYKIIYFNLKDIFSNGCDQYNYFKNALMKYYSSNNYCPQDIEENKDSTEKDKFNYREYLNSIEKLENKANSFDKDNFWNLIFYFCKSIKYNYNSIIIIDQYKSDFDKDTKNNLKQLLSIYGENGFIKFIIASSLNDNSVKEDLKDDLISIYEDKIDEINLLKDQNEIVDIEIEDELFKDFIFNQTNNPMIENKDFSKISMFNINNDNDSKNIDNNKENNNKIEQKKERQTTKNSNNSTKSNKKKIENYEIIYINNLVSIEQLVENSDDEDIYNLFNFNPKTYSKYNFILQNFHSSLSKNEKKSFLDSRFEEIDEKINIFYRNLKNNKKYSSYSSESLKGTFLMNLNDIIKNSKILNLKQLIQYLEVFPFKYLKIYLAESNLIQKENIINMDKDLKNKNFILDYSYDFIEIAFSKIIDMIPSSTIIDMKDLTGSGIGSLIENKIKRNLEKNGFIIKNFWNFTSKSDSGNKSENEEKYIYDCNNYLKIKLVYDGEKNRNSKLDYNKYYYIVPGSETNRSLDSVILQPNNNKSFNMIFLQITKFKQNFKNKSEYIRDCILAKKKFESVYKIKINNMYFYFVLAKEFDNKDTKEELDTKNISYFYYSILDNNFLKDEIIDLESLCDIEAEIYDNNQVEEYQYFNSKLALINYVEKFLQKKRKLDNTFQITESKYELARKHVIKRASNIYIDNDIKNQMEKIVKKSKVDSMFTFKYIFNIFPNESSYFFKKENIIGVMIQHDTTEISKNKYIYFYKGQTYPNNCLVPLKFFNINEYNPKNEIPKDSEYLISQIPENYWDRIYVFKIYSLLPEDKPKKKK